MTHVELREFLLVKEEQATVAIRRGRGDGFAEVTHQLIDIARQLINDLEACEAGGGGHGDGTHSFTGTMQGTLTKTDEP
jgi:hypothetical protein